MATAKHILTAIVPVVVNAFWYSMTSGSIPNMSIYRGYIRLMSFILYTPQLVFDLEKRVDLKPLLDSPSFHSKRLLYTLRQSLDDTYIHVLWQIGEVNQSQTLDWYIR